MSYHFSDSFVVVRAYVWRLLGFSLGVQSLIRKRLDSWAQFNKLYIPAVQWYVQIINNKPEVHTGPCPGLYPEGKKQEMYIPNR